MVVLSSDYVSETDEAASYILTGEAYAYSILMPRFFLLTATAGLIAISYMKLAPCVLGCSRYTKKANLKIEYSGMKLRMK